MIIGLLICDHARKEMNHPDGSYPEMFRRLLPGFEFTDYYVCDGVFPESPHECDGWLISGSRLSVYDDIDWIHRLKGFIRLIAVSGNPCIGVCFGHQMIGAALGGTVKKAESGWCIGVHEFEVMEHKPWMIPSLNSLSLLMMCQDQVVELPPDAIVLASSSRVPNAMILVGDNMFGIQGHPEFSIDFEEKLIGVNAPFIEPGQVTSGLSSLSKTIQSEEVGLWMGLFLKQ